MRAIAVTTVAVCATVASVCMRGDVVYSQGIQARQIAPMDRAVDFKLSELEQITKEMAQSKQVTDRILEGGTFSINVRRIAGAETALVHGTISEVWVIREGAGTLATGGSLVDPKKGASGDGELSGSSIRGGVERTIKAGDVVFIPPGVPHGIKESASGVTYLNIRFETR
jgi:mannose-6-phosphate isomerase-like protein (cupin superfamily)